jgi:serine/threonine protein kinase/tetratricopeptide (TPR) repeat protein
VSVLSATMVVKKRAGFYQKRTKCHNNWTRRVPSPADHALIGTAKSAIMCKISAGNMIGRTILQYTILEKLGQGGMGVVYKAEDTRLKRSVALKFLPRDVAARSGDRVELNDEARLAASLNHPHVATIYSLEESQGELFIVMEYIPGRTLESLIEDDGVSGIPMDRRIELALQIASAIQAAHQKGIVHGDIKCSNIMITPDGNAKILDFGVARVLGGTRVEGGTPGTIAYMSPEQARGEPYDSRSDIWAMGVVLYRLFSGVHPFRHSYEQAILYSIIHEKPPGVRKYDPGIPEEIEGIVARCMEKNPAERFQTAGEVLKRFEETRAQRPLETISSGKVQSLTARMRKPIPLAVTGSIILAAIVGVFLLLRDGERSEGGFSRAIAVLPLQNIAPDRSEDYLGDGITEAIITDLSKNPDLSVIARRSVMQYIGDRGNLKEIAGVLGVRYILDGSIQKSGSRIRVNVQLIDASTGEDLWAERYDREMGDLFALQDDISAHIASTLTRGVLSSERGRGVPLTGNMAAYDFYLRGMSYAAQLDRLFQGSGGPSDEIAIGMFEQAVALDPRFAAARGALANSYITKMFNRDPSPIWGEKASRQIDTALSLDPRLAEAHLAKGSLLWTRQNGFPHAEAMAEVRKAIGLRPSYADAHALLGVIYVHVGLLEESEAEFRTSLRLDPNNTTTRNRFPGLFMYRQEYERSLEEFKRNPGLGDDLKWMMVLSLDHLGKRDEASKLLDSLLRHHPENEDLAASHAVLLAASGDHARAEREIARAIEFGSKKSHFHHVQFNIACAYALMGLGEKSVEWLRQAAKNGLPSYPLFARDEFLRPLQGNPAYSALLDTLKMQLQAYRQSIPRPE